jgi:uncharacterized membrane protein
MESNQNTQSEKEFNPSTNRIEAFSDGVFAIVVTLLVLELRVPELARNFTNAESLNALYNMAPKFIGFVMSFVVIAIYWVNHHQLFHSLDGADRPLLWFNNFLLFWLCFVPFPTAFIGEYPLQTVPVMLYGLVMTLCGIAFNMLVVHSVKAGLFKKSISDKRLKQSIRRGQMGPVIYFASVIAALISPYISLGIFVLVPVLYFIPQKIVEDKK